MEFIYMKAGMLTAYVSRRAGGLFWSVRALAKGLKGNGCDISVFAGEDGFVSEDISKWENVPVRLFPLVGPEAFGFQKGLSGELDAAELDLLHVHNLWMYTSVASSNWGRRNKKPYVISPRGTLDPWALQNSAWKKRIARVLYEDAHLEGAACIHALCDSEYESIRALGLRNPVAVIPNGVDLPQDVQGLKKVGWGDSLPSDSKVLLFISRIHPKKGLVGLLNAWAQVKAGGEANAEPWHLVIGGWDQGGHQAELVDVRDELGVTSSVHFVGPLFDEAKDASLRRADAFVLPSFSEGLPMAVLEAWSYMLPVVMTPQCNIPEGFRSGAAIRVETEVGSISAGLCQLFSLSEEERADVGRRGLEVVKTSFTWDMVSAQMHDVYQWMTGGGSAPHCVRFD